MGRFVTNHGTFSSNRLFRSLIPFFASLLLLKSSRISLRADKQVETSARICEDGLYKYTYIKCFFA